jgi:hypothetical protein
MLMQGVGNNDSGSGYYVPMVSTDAGGSLRISVRSRTDVGAVASLVDRRSLDRDLPMDDVMTMGQVSSETVLRGSRCFWPSGARDGCWRPWIAWRHVIFGDAERAVGHPFGLAHRPEVWCCW